MTIRGILFDKDGTLFDYHQTWMPLNWNAAKAAAHGDDDLARQLMISGGWNPGTDRVASGSLIAASTNLEIARAWAEQSSGWEIDDLAEKITELFSVGGAESAVPVTDLSALFMKLSAYKLGIATSDSERGARAMLDRFKVTDKLDFISGYDSGYGAKPEPGMVIGFYEQTGLQPKDVIMVGDNWHDIETGQRAGVAMCIGVLTGTSLRSDLENSADHVLNSVAELPDFLENLSA